MTGTSSRKTRLISLRLSEEEFEALKSLYSAHGAKSISEFARDAMQRVISKKMDDKFALELKIQEMDGKLSILDGEVARLSQIIESELAFLPRNRHE